MKFPANSVSSLSNTVSRLSITFTFLLTCLLLVPAGIHAQTLVQTINLKQPDRAAALTSIAVDPGINTLYVADGATTNVYLIDTTTNGVTGTVYTAAFGTGSLTPAPPQVGIDGLPLGPGYLPNVVLANPLTHTWVWMGQSEGVKFNGTTFGELVTGKAMRLGGAWDPVTDNMYFADSLNFWAVSNVKFLFAGQGLVSNAVAVNPMTGRVYSSSRSIVVYDGTKFTGFRNPAPTPLASVDLGVQASGLAVNPNTNRIYAAVIMAGTPSLDVIDASTHQVLASIPGLSGPGSVPPNPFANNDYLDFNAVNIAINTLTNTIFVVNPASSTVSVFDGNSNTLTGTIATPDGVVACAVNEQTNTLYVANSGGTVNIYALDPPVAAPFFSVNGIVKDAQGVAQAGINVTATGANGTATAVTDATGLFVLTGLPSGDYTLTPSAAAFSFSAQTVTVNGANISGLAFIANPPIVPASYTLNPFTTIGPGVATTATVTLNQPAPAGGAVLILSASDTKSVKFPATVIVPAGQSSVSFNVQGNGVSVATLVILRATYNGGTASTTITVGPGDSLKIITATWSRSSQLLTVTATSTKAEATLTVLNGKTNAPLGTMTNLGNGNYSSQQTISSGVPTSINVVSNLGGKTGQGITIIN